MRFENPPLIELIAELRWAPGGMSPPIEGEAANPAALIAALGRPSDQLFMRFAGLIGAKGFTHSERLAPPNWPGLPFQPVYRYSRKGTQPGEPVFQVGPGIFTAHITPPYQSWDQFRPFVSTGVDALLASREPAEQNSPFFSASVRYLDCFTDSYLQGHSIGAFLSEVLGIRIDLPRSLTKYLVEGSEVTPALQLAVPLIDGGKLEVSFGSGQTPTAKGLIMNSAVSTSRSVEPSQQEVMQFLDSAHHIVSDLFVDLTAKLHAIMEPTE